MLDNTVTCTSGVPNLVLQPKIKTKSKIPHQAETTTTATTTANTRDQEPPSFSTSKPD
jgi:hypothetical protein